MPLYGGALVGQVVYMAGNAKGCEVFAKRLPATELPTILLVERGGAQRRCPARSLIAQVLVPHLLEAAVADLDCAGGASSLRQTATSLRR